MNEKIKQRGRNGRKIFVMPTEIKVGQVWREKDKQLVRCIRITRVISEPIREARIKAVLCNCDGWSTKMEISNLQSRFELVSAVKDDGNGRTE